MKRDVDGIILPVAYADPDDGRKFQLRLCTKIIELKNNE